MRSCLFILLMCVCFKSSGLFADNGEIDPLLNNRVVNRSINNLQLYDYVPSEHLRIRLLTPLSLYETKELKGNPTFLIDSEKVTDLRGNEKKVYKFKDYFKVDPKTDVNNVKDLPFEFVAASDRGFYLGITYYKNGIAIVKDKNKEYFFELSTNKFSGNEWPSPIWKTDTKRESVVKYLQNLENTDKEFQAKIRPVRKCLNEKNIECFKKSINDEFNNIDQEITTWSISKDVELCKIFKENLDKETELAKKIKIKIKVIPWEIYEKGFSFKDPEIQFTHTIEEFGKNESIELFLQGKQACQAGEYFELMFVRKLGQSTNNWDMNFKRGIVNPVGD